MNTLIKNVLIVNEGRLFHSDVLIKNNRFDRLDSNISVKQRVQEINGEGLTLFQIGRAHV